MKKYTHKDWLDEGERLFGKDPAQWQFVCPACKRTNTGYEFRDAAVSDPGKMATNCIGRFRTGKDGKEKIGCDWAAYGLMGTMGNGVTITMDDGKEIEAFAFADGGTQ